MHQELLFTYSLEKKNLYLKGFADLIFLFEEKYYILDWKLNRLENYSTESMEKEMLAHEYTMQAEIYAKALEKHLAISQTRDFSEVFGGSFYFFLRGKENGVYYLCPSTSLELVEAKL